MLQAKKAINQQLLAYSIYDTHLHISTDKGIIKVYPYTQDIIRILYTLKDVETAQNSLGIIANQKEISWQVEETSTSLLLKTDKLIIDILKETCAITYKDSDDNLLLREPKYDGKVLDPFSSYKTLLDDDTEVEKIGTADGIKETIVNARKEFDRTLYHGKLSFEWQEDESLYGLGQQEEGVLNLRGHRQYVYQANKKIAMPFLISSKGYGLLLDTYSPIIFSDNCYGSYLHTEAVETLDFYFILGPKYDHIISGYRHLTGQATMLPKWAFGYMQSFERYESAQELIETVEEYRRRSIPIDCIVLDWQSWEGEQWGQKGFDRSRFPDPKAMIDELHKHHVAFMISIWPNMDSSTDNHKDLLDNGGLLQRSDLYNAFDSNSRDIYWQQTKYALFNYGIDAWWTDASEPFTPAWLSEEKIEPEHAYMKFHDIAKTYVDETMTNAYPIVHAQTLYEGQRSVTSDKRVCNLTRSGYTGQQRYGNILWSGDIIAKWSTLRQQIASGLNLCASGLPYWTLDIGAFFVKRSTAWYWQGDYDLGNQDPNYRKLYTRWFQYATFLPVLRAHGTDTRREVWQFGDKGDIYYDTIVKFIQLRYKLLPYIYSMAGQVTQLDYTMMRLLAFDFNHDPKVHWITDQYMFGPSFMVCPITDDTSKRSVYLPSESKWYDYWSSKIYEGGQTLILESPMDQLPLFIKAGSIIPTSNKDIQHTGDCPTDRYDLNVYTGADGEFTLYEDAGDNYDYEQGQFRMLKITWNDDLQELILHDSEGSYDGMANTIDFNIIINGEVSSSLAYTGKKTVFRVNK